MNDLKGGITVVKHTVGTFSRIKSVSTVLYCTPSGAGGVPQTVLAEMVRIQGCRIRTAVTNLPWFKELGPNYLKQ